MSVSDCLGLRSPTQLNNLLNRIRSPARPLGAVPLGSAHFVSHGTTRKNGYAAALIRSTSPASSRDGGYRGQEAEALERSGGFVDWGPSEFTR
jgi:hypothetical protein